MQIENALKSLKSYENTPVFHHTGPRRGAWLYRVSPATGESGEYTLKASASTGVWIAQG